MIDKSVEHLTRICDRRIIMELDRTLWSGTPHALMADQDLQHRYLGF